MTKPAITRLQPHQKAANSANSNPKSTSRFIDHKTGLTFGARGRLVKAQNSTKPQLKKTSVNFFLDYLRDKVAEERFDCATVNMSQKARQKLWLFMERLLLEVYSCSGEYMRNANRRSLKVEDVQRAVRYLRNPAYSTF